MQFVEDYSEPQPSVFYQTPQSESIYEQRNRLIQEVYGFSDSFSSSDSVHEPLPPPALPPKQRQLVSSTCSTHSRSFSFPRTGTRCHAERANTPHVVYTPTHITIDRTNINSDDAQSTFPLSGHFIRNTHPLPFSSQP